VGFEPSGILGTSIGALIGAGIAGGRDLDEMESEARALARDDIARVQRRTLWLAGVRSPSLFRGEVLREYLEKVLPKKGWESCAIRFQTNSVELGTGRTEWFGIGARMDVPLLDAVYASCALPLFYPPITLPGGVYVDGGADAALPILRAAELGATGIVAVDVGAGGSADGEKVVEKGMIAIHERIFSIFSGRLRRETVEGWSGPPMLYIRPELGQYGGFDFAKVGLFIDTGEEATERTLLGEGYLTD
jgi:NTE family protein